jgi:hypothetical protein
MRLLACFLALALFASAGAARAQSEDPAAIDKVVKLNKRAVDEYENLNFEEARKILKDALAACTQGGLDNHPVAARTHVHLGVVLLAGFKMKDQATKEFKRAVEIQADIKLEKTLANPEIQDVFDQATAGQGGEGGGAGAAAPAADAITHEPVNKAEQGKPIPITASIDSSVGAKKMVLQFSADGSEDFGAREMHEESPGNWTGEIPASATEGAKVRYYLEASGAGDQVVATKGSAAAPLVVKLRGPGGAALVTKKLPVPTPVESESTGPSWYLSIGFGSGVGWTTGNGEVNGLDKISPPGFALAKLVHIAPEIGYYLSPQLLVSAQGRFQIITGPTPFYSATQCTGGECAPASYAIAGLGRLRWLFGEQGDSLHPFVGGVLGLGTIRHVTSFASETGCGLNHNLTCVDTIKSGPVFAGATGGVLYNLTPMFALSLETNVLAGFTKFTLNFDLNAGVAIEF